MDDSIPYSMYPDGSQAMYHTFGLPSDPLSNTTHQHFLEQPSTEIYNHVLSHDPQFQYDPNTFAPQVSPPSHAFDNPPSVGIDRGAHDQNYFPSDVHVTPLDEYPPVRSSSSEEKDGFAPITKDKRKEQNRAAQRAFRERKEKHVKELEQKLNILQEEYSSSQSDVQRLKRELAKVATERDVLRATQSPSHPLNAFTDSPFQDEEPTHTGPMQFIPTDSYRLFVNSRGVNKSPSLRQPGKVSSPHTISRSPRTGEKLLTAGEAWDVIQAHELFQQGLVDIGDVCERLKKLAKCNGQGPTFGEFDVRRIVEQSAAGGGKDELL